METSKRQHQHIRGRGQWLFVSILLGLAGITILYGIGIWTTERANMVGELLNDEEYAAVIARNSPLTEYVSLSPHADFPRENQVDRITIHHMAGSLSLEELGTLFSMRDRTASANYGIDTDGRVGLYVEEDNAPWSSSSKANDSRAVTIEVANDEPGGEWHVSDAALDKLVELVTDICVRNGIEALSYTGDTTGNLTLHCMFSDTECPGPYLLSKTQEIERAVNERLSRDKE